MDNIIRKKIKNDDFYLSLEKKIILKEELIKLK
jgi:hypothetical protein